MNYRQVDRELDRLATLERAWNGENAAPFAENVIRACKELLACLELGGFTEIDLIPDTDGNVVILVDGNGYLARFDVRGQFDIEYDLEINDYEYPTEYFGLSALPNALNTLRARLSELCSLSERLAQDGGYGEIKSLTSSPSRQARVIKASPQSAFPAFSTAPLTYVPT
ncbi:MAG: hypothetical protein HUU46_24885 [Candidatus Hydrogenedentes bacterium]|nr:hypothetical protein [Candidatus Hydrogenedentota bacterium]